MREENCQSLAIKFCRDAIIQEPSQTNVMLASVTPGNPCDTGIYHCREPLWVKRLAMPKVVSFIPSASSWLLTNPSCFAGTKSCPGLILAPARVRQPEGCSDGKTWRHLWLKGTLLPTTHQGGETEGTHAPVRHSASKQSQHLLFPQWLQKGEA